MDQHFTSSKLLIVLLIVPLLFSLTSAQKKDSCTACHSEMDGPLGEPAQRMKNDIHKVRGLSCVDCHGGDATEDDPARSMDPRKGFIGKPKSANIPAFCGKCHSNADFIKKFNPALRVDQEREYFTSVHGKLLKTGDQKVATCISCHGVHGIRAIADPQSSVYSTNVAETCAKCHANADYMQGYKIPHDQYDKYKSSAHANELLAANNNAIAILNRAERAGMEVSRPKFELSEAKDSLTNARVLIHSFSIGEVGKVVNPGLEVARKSYRAGENAMAELGFRRKGLVVSLFFILFLAALVYFKIREIEGRQQREFDSDH